MRNQEKKQIEKIFSGTRWDMLTGDEKSQLGRWRADEKMDYCVGDITVLYNETVSLQIAGRVVCGGYYPLPEARIERISNKEWKEKLKKW